MKKKSINTTTLITRIIVLILAVMMVLGTCAMAIMYGLSSKTAVDVTPVASAALFTEDQKIRVGIVHGDNAAVSTVLTSKSGFSIGTVGSDHTYNALWQVADTTLSVACDFHLRENSSGYLLGSEASADVGGYHICLMSGTDIPFDRAWVVEDEIKEGTIFQDGFPSEADRFYAFPAIRDRKNAIMVGDFPTRRAAEDAMHYLISAYPSAKVVGPSESSVSLLGTEGRVKFEADATDALMLGLKPRGVGDAIGYNDYAYSGVFAYRRLGKAVELLNIVPLERYVEGVLPYEISSSWPDEAQKAFAVTVRNYALTHIGVHQKGNFDVCATTCCQVYRGCTRVNERVERCVAATEGIVCTYDGEVQRQWYSSSVGGTTVDVADAWGGRSYPYLHAIATPWEKYDEHTNGSWTTQFTPEMLAKTIRNNGYPSLTGKVTSIVIEEFSKNSNYVIKLTVTDQYGHRVTLENSDHIRIVLGLKSANFVVGKAGETVAVTDYGLKGYGDFASDAVERFPAITLMTADGRKTTTAASPLWALMGNGKKLLDAAPSIWIRNATDVNRFLSEAENVTELPKTEYSGLLDFNQLERTSKVRYIKLNGYSGNYVFVGRGWGHGVGSSQYGYYDLAVMGYTWQEIIRFYYSDCPIQHYTSLIE